jgi:hypothetical protein
LSGVEKVTGLLNRERDGAEGESGGRDTLEEEGSVKSDLLSID